MQLSRRQIVAYVAVAAVVVAVGVRYVIAPRVAGPSGGEPLVLSSVAPDGGTSVTSGSAAGSSGPAASSSASPAAEAVVYVCGAVRSPGVVRLPKGSRVADALELAGGATARAELAAVNLAALVADGQQILVPERAALGASSSGAVGLAPAAGAAAGGSAAGAGAGAAVTGGPVNINTASLEQLDTLQGIGPSTAQKIIDYRTANGPFATIDDLKNVSSIGDAKFAAVKDSITV
jgi:competence protein ComEA